jgi:multidrug resistance efflux pump
MSKAGLSKNIRRLVSSGGNVLDDCAAREELGLRLAEAEVALKEAEAEYERYFVQLEKYRRTIQEQKAKIAAIKMNMISQIH